VAGGYLGVKVASPSTIIKEFRRLRAWELHRDGWSGQEIAEALGVSEAAVSQWLAKARTAGPEALRAAWRGSRPRLTEEQRARLPELLARGAEAFGFAGALWTTARIADVIEREFGVRYHRDHIGKLLRRCGWTYQKPVRRASQRDEAAIAAWKARFADVKKKAEAEGRTVLFVDESAFYLLPAVAKTWAPVGRTPVLTAPLTRDHLSAISAVSADGALYVQVQKHAFDGAGVAGFVRHLLVHVPGPMLIVWDGAPIHRSREVKELLALDEHGRIVLETFPAYAPEVDPDEYVWRQLKHVELRNQTSYTLDQLHQRLLAATKRLRQRAALLRNLVDHALAA